MLVLETNEEYSNGPVWAKPQTIVRKFLWTIHRQFFGMNKFVGNVIGREAVIGHRTGTAWDDWSQIGFGRLQPPEGMDVP